MCIKCVCYWQQLILTKTDECCASTVSVTAAFESDEYQAVLCLNCISNNPDWSWLLIFGRELSVIISNNTGWRKRLSTRHEMIGESTQSWFIKLTETLGDWWVLLDVSNQLSLSPTATHTDKVSCILCKHFRCCQLPPRLIVTPALCARIVHVITSNTPVNVISNKPRLTNTVEFSGFVQICQCDWHQSNPGNEAFDVLCTNRPRQKRPKAYWFTTQCHQQHPRRTENWKRGCDKLPDSSAMRQTRKPRLTQAYEFWNCRYHKHLAAITFTFWAACMNSWVHE